MHRIIGLLIVLVIELFLGLLVRFGASPVAAALAKDVKGKFILGLLGYAIAGVLFGWLSLVLLPDPVLQQDSWKVLNLILTPILAGLVMSLFARPRTRRGDLTGHVKLFAYGWVFALALTLVRFVSAA